MHCGKSPPTQEEAEPGDAGAETKAAMAALGVPSRDFAGFIKSERPDGAGWDYALRYGELIPLLIEQTQRIKARVAELERRIP